MKTLKTFLAGAVVASMSMGAMAGEMTSVNETVHPLASGGGAGGGTWSEAGRTGVITMVEDQESKIGSMSHVITNSTVVLTPDGNGYTGKVMINNCTKIGGLYNGCNDLVIGAFVPVDSVSSLEDNGDGTKTISTVVSSSAIGGTAVTTVTYTLMD